MLNKNACVYVCIFGGKNKKKLEKLNLAKCGISLGGMIQTAV